MNASLTFTSASVMRVRYLKDALAFASKAGGALANVHGHDDRALPEFSSALRIFVRKTPKSWRGKGKGSERGA